MKSSMKLPQHVLKKVFFSAHVFAKLGKWRVVQPRSAESAQVAQPKRAWKMSMLEEGIIGSTSGGRKGSRGVKSGITGPNASSD